MLTADPKQPGIYATTFRAAVPGRYQARLSVPEVEKPISTTVEVTLPQLEQLNPQQNRPLLARVAEETNGQYFTLADAAAGVPKLFRASAAESVPIDERLTTLWDRRWVLFTLVGLLGLEWLVRKLLKLA